MNLLEKNAMNIDYINNLPLDEYISVIESMNQEQYKDYCSCITTDKKQEPVHVIAVNYGFDDERSGVDAKKFINELREKRQNRQQCNES